MSEKLFTEFPPVTTEAWIALVTKDLKGADFEKSLRISPPPSGLKALPGCAATIRTATTGPSVRRSPNPTR